MASDTEICFHETSRTANERQSVFDRNISKFRLTLGKVLNLSFQSLVVFSYFLSEQMAVRQGGPVICIN